ncbi:asparagine synthase (glutamine-hydrolyzing) [Desulforamulus ferrireducens]|uniref:asparagine synthase (glutamine-hydrolyzing) n=1 Tax=Desulforamulus ferrireducens TaxID=1833852 RepID=A0A1S6J003_9FIRM|nr:asparagine synthase (glutamine-hydrolyzing) [Desulforamulus ferrireducens]AQS60351.1 asparagine synthase (glutamine-hydrolyzing) [Desulforamulus ferrireducens]
MLLETLVFTGLQNCKRLNYLELQKQLLELGYMFETNSDTEVLLKSYQAFGLDFLDKIDGMFAFALVDFTKNKLYLVRDRLGIKPLYYHVNTSSITFASEIKALIKSGAVSAEIDPFGLCDYIHIQLYTQNHTLFKGVKSIRPGAFLSVDLANYTIVEHVYWDLPQEEAKLDYDEAILNLRERIFEAVKLWCRADVPISAYVSGGLDSSSVATIAKQFLNKKVQANLHTFSSIFPEARFQDERPYSDAVAKHIGSEHHRVILPKEEIIKAHDDLLYVLDMPIAGYSAPYRIMSKIVRQHTRVVLTGHGGDELFCGYPKYIAAVLSKEISDSISGSNRVVNSSNIKYLVGFERQARQILGKSVFGDEKQIIKSLFFRTEELWQYVNPEFRSAVGDYSVSDSLLNMCSNRTTGYLKKLLYLDAKVLLPGLLHVEDRTSMIENLESRTPLLDRKVVEFAGQVPEAFLLRDGLKGMIRKAMEPVLPRMVSANPSKSGTMYPATELFDKELADLIHKDFMLLDKTGLFIKPVHEILSESQELINKRVTWAIWSLGAWIRAFKIF